MKVFEYWESAFFSGFSYLPRTHTTVQQTSLNIGSNNLASNQKLRAPLKMTLQASLMLLKLIKKAVMTGSHPVLPARIKS
jgi:hypothetical protein